MKQPIQNMKLAYYPTGDVTQFFAENPKLYAHLNMKGHNGIDLIRPHGELMYAIEDGTVVEAKNSPEGYGMHIRIISDTKNSAGHHREWTYGHNSKNLVKQGDKVTAGQAVATMGNTGFVVSGPTPHWVHNPYAGTHLHLGLRYCKVVNRGGWSYPGSDIKLQVMNHGNGYFGSVDPLPELYALTPLVESDKWRELALTVISLWNTFTNLRK